MLLFLKYLRGYVTFLITGTFPHKIINKCKNKNIPVWDIKNNKSYIEAKTYASAYKKMRKLRTKNTRTRVIEKHGLPFKAKFLKKRYGIFIGTVFSLIILFVLCSRIWVIEVKTDDLELKKEILASLKTIGISTGIKINKINTKEAARKLLISDDRIAWDGINIKGCRLTVEVNKKTEPPVKKFEKEKHADLIASDDGQILYQEIKNGKRLFEKGETVQKGEILVSGTIVDKYGGIRCVYAQGKVMALCSMTLTVSTPKTNTLPYPDGETFVNYKIAYKNKAASTTPKDKICNSIKLSEQSLKIPIFKNIRLQKEIYLPVKYKRITYSNDEILKKSEENFKKLLKNSALGDIKILKSKTFENKDTVFLTKELLYVKDIALVREF